MRLLGVRVKVVMDQLSTVSLTTWESIIQTKLEVSAQSQKVDTSY